MCNINPSAPFLAVSGAWATEQGQCGPQHVVGATWGGAPLQVGTDYSCSCTYSYRPQGGGASGAGERAVCGRADAGMGMAEVCNAGGAPGLVGGTRNVELLQ